MSERLPGGGRRAVVGPQSCEDHRAHVVGCLDCAFAVCMANDDDLGDFLARMEHIGWPSATDDRGGPDA